MEDFEPYQPPAIESGLRVEDSVRLAQKTTLIELFCTRAVIVALSGFVGSLAVQYLPDAVPLPKYRQADSFHDKLGFSFLTILLLALPYFFVSTLLPLVVFDRHRLTNAVLAAIGGAACMSLGWVMMGYEPEIRCAVDVPLNSYLALAFLFTLVFGITCEVICYLALSSLLKSDV